jgi:hypothetical protein
MLAC